MTTTTISLRQMLTRLDLDGVGRGLLWERWREGRLTLKARLTEQPPGAAERIEHGVVAIDAATPFGDEWNHDQGYAWWWQQETGAIFHLNDIHADPAEFARLRPVHKKPGPKSFQDEHIARAAAIMATMTGKVTLDRVAELVEETFVEEPKRHGRKAITEHIREAVRAHKGKKRP
jgi:hypothetical protein